MAAYVFASLVLVVIPFVATCWFVGQAFREMDAKDEVGYGKMYPETTSADYFWFAAGVVIVLAIVGIVALFVGLCVACNGAGPAAGSPCLGCQCPSTPAPASAPAPTAKTVTVSMSKASLICKALASLTFAFFGAIVGIVLLVKFVRYTVQNARKYAARTNQLEWQSVHDYGKRNCAV